MNRSPNQRTTSGNYRPLRTIHGNMTALPVRNPASEFQPNNQTTQQNTILEQLRWEWQQNNFSTESFDRIQGIMNVFNSEVGRTQAKRMWEGLLKCIKKIPLNEVMNLMSKEKDLAKLLKSIGKGDSSDILQNMMNDPKMKQSAMDMMQEMMSDEKKMAEMTEMMTKMLNPDKK